MKEDIFKTIIKWGTIAMIATLFIFPLQTNRTIAGLFITGEFWGLFKLTGVLWLWTIFMIAGPIAMFLFKDKNNMIAFIAKAAGTFTSFLGALIFICICLGNNLSLGFGAWIYMFVSLGVCGVVAADGIIKMVKNK